MEAEERRRGPETVVRARARRRAAAAAAAARERAAVGEVSWEPSEPPPLPAPRYQRMTMDWVGQVMEAEDRRVAAERARALLRAADEERRSC